MLNQGRWQMVSMDVEMMMKQTSHSCKEHRWQLQMQQVRLHLLVNISRRSGHMQKSNWMVSQCVHWWSIHANIHMVQKRQIFCLDMELLIFQQSFHLTRVLVFKLRILRNFLQYQRIVILLQKLKSKIINVIYK